MSHKPRYRLLLIPIALACTVAASWSLKPKPALAAASNPAAPGQLTIINKNGQAGARCHRDRW